MQTLNLHLWWLPSATCAGGLFSNSTGAYTACTYCNLHCGGGGIYRIFIVTFTYKELKFSIPIEVINKPCNIAESVVTISS